MTKPPCAEAVDYCFANGIIKYNSQFKVAHAPVCLNPFMIIPDLLESIVASTPIYNEFMMKIGNDPVFLQESLGEVAQTDDFIKRLLDLLDSTENLHHLQISRNDFLITKDLETSELIPKQVEFNSISNSFPYLSKQVNKLHQYLEKRLQCRGKLVINDPLEGVVDTMGEVVQNYGLVNAQMLMVVQSNEQNIFDQRGIEYRLLQKYGIYTIRLTLEEIAEQARIKEGHLFINNTPIALTYFRAAYTPNDYKNEDAWKGREIIENSSTVKCPSVGMQLAGAKKIQQILVQPGSIEKFVDPEQAVQIRRNFVGMFEPDELVNGKTARELAIESPQNYVLKPQREGGGNNLYNEDIATALKRFNENERKAYILMERINTPIETSTLVVESIVEEVQTVSEIGRYATCFYDGKEITKNEDVGYLVRTKASDQNEGGVCAGYACLNSLCIDTR